MSYRFVAGLLFALGLGWVLGAAPSPAPPSAALPVPELDDIPSFPRQVLTNLWRIADWQDEVPWQPFRPGIEIHRLYGDGSNGPTAALLRYRQAAKVPIHAHTGFEHILLLDGSQRDQNGVLRAGTLAVHPPGTSHSVISDTGCIVLAIYEKPVRFAPAPPHQP